MNDIGYRYERLTRRPVVGLVEPPIVVVAATTSPADVYTRPASRYDGAIHMSSPDEAGIQNVAIGVVVPTVTPPAVAES